MHLGPSVILLHTAGFPTEVGFPAVTMSLSILLFFYEVFLFVVVQKVFIQLLSSSLGGIALHVGIDLVHSVGGGEFRPFLCCCPSSVSSVDF